MKYNNLIKILNKRLLINQITKEEEIKKILFKKKIALYCGFDPTADSLHLGHLLPIILLKRFQLLGHKPIILIGGATSLIGDPSFKLNERKLNNKNDIKIWSKKIENQIKYFLDFNYDFNNAIIINNYKWYKKINILYFLRNIGKYFYINKMIKKDFVKQRLNFEDKSISFTEFSYNLLQSYDFLKLYKKYKVILQIGGSDQWGNIVSGIDLIYRIYKKKVFGLTSPIIKQSNGIKFGKTEKKTIWLSKKKTSPYKFYQFWINVSDKDVYNFLKIFTFINIKKIDKLEKEEKKNTKKPKAQYILAKEITRLVHGKKELNIALRITKNLFKDCYNNLTKFDFLQLELNIPTISFYINVSLKKSIIKAGFVNSYSKAYKIIKSNSISINNIKQSNPEYIFNKKDRLYNYYTIIKKGKKNFCLILWKNF
ncbi:tyrosine--tRNA ligase [Enterobacterales bacterium endosymbiont of Anomoneura mori]|uniref:tyrosine--tRNA ligase n=1 Tax=Enterobacterales bacterium endosymbiont of Anomoneura mori TaxID=3132096 RepID=UPI00399D4D7D